MRMLHATAVGICLLGAGSAPAYADVQLSLENGRVTLVARDATVRQILTEWARVGQTTIVNVDRIPGGPLTLQFTGVPEEEALDVLLRSVSGYMAATRPTAVSTLSRFDRIMVMPTVAAPRTAAAAPAPVFQPPGFVPGPPRENNDPNQAAPSIVTPARGPIFQAFPQPQVVNPTQGATSPPTTLEQAPPAATYPAASTLGGSPRPGMVVQPVVPPGQPQPEPVTVTAQPNH
jgi:hypothetical protein